MKITASAGPLDAADLTFVGAGTGGQLARLNLTDGGFNGANITFTVTKAANGDGLAAVGFIDATDRDLGTVTVKGDLGQIEAGDDAYATPGLEALNVRSMGRYGLATQGGAGDLRSDIASALGALNVAGDFKDASLFVIGNTEADIGSLTIGGSLIGGADQFSGYIGCEGALGALKIGGDLRGGAGLGSGLIEAVGKLASVTIAGSILGGTGKSSGGLVNYADMGPVKIGRDLRGGAGEGSGFLACDKDLASLSIGGSLVGGIGQSSGNVGVVGNLGPLKIGRDLIGGYNRFAGCIECGGFLESLTIGGAIVAATITPHFDGQFDYSASVKSYGSIGTVKVGRDLSGGAGMESGAISSWGAIANVSVGGSLRGGTGESSGGIFSGRETVGSLGPVKIGGGIVGGAGLNSGQVSAATAAAVLGDAEAGSIASLTVGGSIVGGTGVNSGAALARDFGAVKIARDLLGGAGIGSGAVFSVGNSIAAQKIASVSIGGTVLGGAGAFSGQLGSVGDTGAVRIDGDVLGGLGGDSGRIGSNAKIGAVTIGGSLIGGFGHHTGEIYTVGDLGPVKIGGDLSGSSIFGEASLDRTGYIQGARIASVTIGGSVSTGFDLSTGTLTKNGSIRAVNDIGPVVVEGDLHGSAPAVSVIISARGQLAPGATTDLAIARVTVGGEVENAVIRAGFGVDEITRQGSNNNAQIGAVAVGGDWITSSITAGVRDGNGGGFGNLDDTLIPTPAVDAIFSRIASIQIGGVVVGTNIVGDQYGFTAQQIGSFKSLGFTAALTSATDARIVLTPLTSDIAIREV